MIYHLLLITGITLAVLGQLFLKKGMNRHKDFKITNIFKLIKNELVMIGLTAYVISMMLWLIVLAKLDLSYAYPMASLNYFFVALSSKWLFKEKVSKKRWLSIAVIVFGVILVSLS